MRTLAALFVLSCVAAVHAQRPAPDPAPTRSQTAASIRITLLGTGAGPPVRPARAGVGTLIEAGSEHLLFDAGYGVLRRLVESGKAMDAVSTVFLTHLHSDHVVELPALLSPEHGQPLLHRTGQADAPGCLYTPAHRSCSRHPRRGGL